jgi:DNA/RNA endonuclease G (NUC1)
MYSISPESDSRVGSETGIHVPHYIWLVIIATSTVQRRTSRSSTPSRAVVIKNKNRRATLDKSRVET